MHKLGSRVDASTRLPNLCMYEPHPVSIIRGSFRKIVKRGQKLTVKKFGGGGGGGGVVSSGGAPTPAGTLFIM